MNFDYTSESLTPETTNSITINGLLDINSVSSTVAAAGTTQATATALSSMANIVTSGTGGISLVIPPGPGLTLFIVNRSGVTITVYPATGGTIDALATNAGFTLPYLASVSLQSSSATQWFTINSISSVAGTANGGPGTISFGATGSRPTAGNLNNIFIDTTLNIIQRDNGSTWITISGGGIGISAGTTSQSSGTVTFSNSNGVSFGLNAGSLTASVAAQSAQTQSNIQAISAGTTSQNTGNIIFGNSNNISFGLNAGTLTGSVPSLSTLSGLGGILISTGGSVVSVSYTGPNIIISAGTTSQTSGTVIFSNANNISFGLNGQTFTGSVAAQSAQTQSNIQGISAGTNIQYTGTVNFSNSNGLSFGLNTNGVLTGSIGPNIFLSAGTTNAVNSGTVVFSNSNGVSFGFNGQTLTASVATAGGGGAAISAGTTSQNTGTIVFSNSNNISFGLNAGTLTGSVPATSTVVGAGGILISSSSNSVTISYTGSQSNQTGDIYIVGNTTYTTASTYDLRSLTVSAGGDISLGWSNGSLVMANATGNFNGLGVSTGGNTTGATGLVSKQVVFVGGNNITLSQATATGGFGTISIIGQTAGGGGGGGVAISAGTNSTSTGTVVFSNSNNISFGLNTNGILTGSVPSISTISGYGGILISTTSNTIAVSYTGPSIVVSAGTTSQTSGTVVFSNSNNISFGLNAGTITGSVPAISQLTGVGGIVLSSGGSTVSISYSAQTTYNMQNRNLGVTATQTLGNNVMWVSPFPRIAYPISASTGLNFMSLSGIVTSASTQTFGATYNLGIYTAADGSATSLSRYWSTSYTMSVYAAGTGTCSFGVNGYSTSSSVSNVLSLLYGLRLMTFNVGSIISGPYMAYGIFASTSSAGGSGLVSMRNILVDNPLSIAGGYFGSNTNLSIGYADAGTYSTTTASLPANFNITQLQQVGNQAPFIRFGCV